MGVLDRKRQADDTSVSAVRYDFHLAIRTGCDAVYHPGIAPHRPVVGCSLNRRPGLCRCSWMRGGRKDRARPPFLSGRSDAGAECSGSSHPTGRSLISPPGILRRHGSGGRYRNFCAAASRSGPGHGFRIPNLRIRGRCPVCCPMHALPGIPEFRGGTGADAATGTFAGASLPGSRHGFRIPNLRIRGRYPVCCPMHALPGIPESRGGTGAGAATGTFAGASRSGRGHGFRIPNLRIRGRCPVCCPMHALPGIPEPRGGTGAGVATGTLVRRHLSPARGTVFGYLYEKRYLFRFIRNISFSGSLRAARERMPLLKLLPGGVSPRPGTSGFFIPSPACRFSPARC